MKEDRITVKYLNEVWEQFKPEQPYSENFCHVLNHDGLHFWCYWTEKRVGKKVNMNIPPFIVGWN